MNSADENSGGDGAVAPRRSLWNRLGITREMKIVFPILFLGWTFSNLDQSLFSFAIPGIQEEFGSSLSDVGWILSFSFAAAAVATVAFGLLSDRYGRRITFTITLGASALFVGLQAVMPTLFSLGVVRIIGFAISNGLVPVVITYAAEAAPPKIRGLAVGVLSLGYPLGGMMSGLIAAPLIANYGWRWIFLPAFAIVPLALLLGWLLPKHKPVAVVDVAANDPWPQRLKALFAPGRRRTSLSCMASNFLFGGAYAGTFFYFPTYLHEAHGMSPSQAAEMMGIALGVGTFGYVLAALFGDFVMSRRDTVSLWMVLGSLGLLAVVWVPGGVFVTLAMMCIMTFFFYGTNGVLGAYMPEMFPAHLRATGVAVVGSLGMYAGFAICPPVVAWLVEVYGWQLAFSVSALPLMAGGLVLLIAERRPVGFEAEGEAVPA